MENKETVSGGFREFWNKVMQVCTSIANGCKLVVSYVVRMRKPIMAVPVVLASLKLAQYNAQHLPDMVGLGLLAPGEYTYMISREAAIMGPMAVTALCLFLMFISRRTVYPWIISLFSLVLPILMLITNMAF